MTFFIGGWETPTSMISNCFFELAIHQDIQDKLRSEVKKLLKTEGKLTYENLSGMKYLDKVYKGKMKNFFIGVSLSYRISKISHPNPEIVSLDEKRNFNVITPIRHVKRLGAPSSFL